MPRASIVIPIYEMAGLLSTCLASLAADGLDDLELILVDNASTESRMTTLLRDWEDRAVVLRNPVNTGFAAGCNQGAAAASAPVVVFLNSDTEVRPGWIDPLIESASEPGAGMVGARLLYPDGRVQHAGMALSDGMQPLHLHQRVPGDHPAVTRTRELQLVTGACCAIDRTLFAEHRGFDTDYTNGYEDVDLCLRLVRDGRRNIYRGDSVVVHHESMSPGRADLESQNAVLFRTRWQGWRSDFAELLAEDGVDDAAADCRWEGPLFDASPEAAFGRAAVHALVEEGRVPFAFEPDPRPLAEAAGALCDDVLLAALKPPSHRRARGRHLPPPRRRPHPRPRAQLGPRYRRRRTRCPGARRHRQRGAHPRRRDARPPGGRRRGRARLRHRHSRPSPPQPGSRPPRRPRPGDGPRGARLVRPP
jgi:GT2 family glycosyltransferase